MHLNTISGTILGTALLGTLPACATTQSQRPPGFSECKAEPAQNFIGQKATVTLGEEVVRLTGATRMRWIAPRSPVTMDLRVERVNIMYNDDMVVEQINCG